MTSAAGWTRHPSWSVTGRLNASPSPGADRNRSGVVGSSVSPHQRPHDGTTTTSIVSFSPDAMAISGPTLQARVTTPHG